MLISCAIVTFTVAMHMNRLVDANPDSTSSWRRSNRNDPSSWSNHDEPQIANPIVERDIFTQKQMDVCAKYFFNIDKYHKENVSLAQLSSYALTAKAHGLVYNDLLTHRYDSYKEVRLSNGPKVDQDKCLLQLKDLVSRMKLAKLEKSKSEDVNLHLLLDTWGRTPAGFLQAHLFWTGAYDECIRLKIEVNDEREPKVRTRYCLAHLRYKSWPKQTAYDKMLAIKTGICLPEVCDPLKYKDKYALIGELMSFNMRQADWPDLYIDSIYCLPDAQSPLSSWQKDPKASTAIMALGLWVSILLIATLKYELDRRARNKLSATGGKETLCAQNSRDSSEEESVRSNESYSLLSITHNFRRLFDTTKGSKLSNGTNDPSEQVPEDSVVDLRCVDGIKVICMMYVIIGHVLMSLTGIFSNGRTIGTDSSVAFLIANMMPAFAVNSFFAITGLLTSYLLFKQNKSHSFITSPLKWFAFIMYRYLRIMPMYLVVVFYSKYLAKYTGSGPMWDYGTSSLGARRQCENESWLWTLLFAANFKHPLEHCIPSAWYLANDFQFFMLTPLLLALLYRRPTLGRVLLQVGVLAGFLAGMYSIFYSDAPDLRPVARFWPHGFKTYITFLTAVYTRPQYRIPAYLCGLLFGHALHEYEQKKLAYRRAIAAKPELSQFLVEPNWSPLFLRFGLMASVFLVTFSVILPLAGFYIEVDKSGSKFAVALSISLYHVLFALAVGFYILLSTTGNGQRFQTNVLSATIFRSMSRMSLCVLLINIEVCHYIIQMHRSQKYVGFLELNALNVLAIVLTYAAAMVVNVSFEAPLRSILNKSLTSIVRRASVRQKQKSQ